VNRREAGSSIGSSRRNVLHRSVDHAALKRLIDGLESRSCSDSAGSTHCFYHYPARFSPSVVNAVLETFTKPGDWVLDPFMGGGTSIVEGLALGRNMLGVDLNTLALFVSRVRTTPLSQRDELRVRRWARKSADIRMGLGLSNSQRELATPRSVAMLPEGARSFFAVVRGSAERLRSRRSRQFARGVLLRLGQWALDCRDFAAPRYERLAIELLRFTGEMLDGLHDFVARCNEIGIRKTDIPARRRLFCRNAIGLEMDARIHEVRPRLVFTSPPYPGVHVLYHRWQYRGRQETGAPYWLASLRDGHPESFYTGGSRTPTGSQNYFRMIESTFRSIRAVMDPRGVVVQLVGFSEMRSQLPRYWEAMKAAGFTQDHQSFGGLPGLARRVPNRKWYAKLQVGSDASTELLMLHRPDTS